MSNLHKLEYRLGRRDKNRREFRKNYLDRKITALLEWYRKIKGAYLWEQHLTGEHPRNQHSGVIPSERVDGRYIYVQ